MNDAQTIASTEVRDGYDLPVYEFVMPEELRSGARPRHKVAIVGGGLTGLTMACDLAERGIESIVLDDDNSVGVQGLASRGPCVARKSLQIFDRLGIYERVRDKGKTWYVGRVMNRDEQLYSFNLDPDEAEKHPPFINIQQYYSEWFLVDRIGELGLTDLRWCSRVTGVAPGDDHVVLSVETPEGAYQLEADWVIAADGAGSAVRTALGIEPAIEAKEDRWCISDVRFKGDYFPTERWIWIEAPFNGNRAVWQHEMGDGVWRLDFQFEPDSDPEEISRRDVAEARLRERLGPDRDFELVWVGPWAYRTYLLDDFRAGRVFFIGDAAHLMSPFGARGGNSGIQDADNLGWKLAMVLDGAAPEALLDSYSEERRAAAQFNIGTTTRSGRFMAPETPLEHVFRTAILDLARDYPFARPMINGGRLSDPFVYAGSSLTTDGGHAAPNPALANGGTNVERRLYDLMRGGARFLGLWFPDADGDQAAKVATLAAERLPIDVYGVGREVAGLRPLDDSGAIADTFGGVAGDFILIRPDQHVAAHLPAATPDRMRAALLKATAGD